MTKPIVSYRRIDQLKAIAFDCGFTNEDARQFGKLSKTATWEALLELYLVNRETLDTVLDLPLDSVGTTPESHDTGETVASSRKQSDCLYTFTKPLDTVLDLPLDSVDVVDTAVGTTPDLLRVDGCVDSVDTLDWTNDGSFPVCGFTRQNSTFLDWVDFGQLIALVLASAGVFVLAMSMWRQINPLNLFPSPVRINIQIGTKL
ncbi:MULTISPECIES: hypothetical protein [unclassified Microcoleus]|uniref:hypothetical protein n=1 Tax=unclassified Microcoleus TaxID=2642155 RepID=UPI002FD604B6